MQFNFGTGTVIGKRTDVANATPSLFGVLQDINVEMDRSLKKLMGQYNMPVAIAGAELKISGKAKFGRFAASLMNNLFLGATLTPLAGLVMAAAENHPIPATPFTVTVANSATFSEDLGVFYHNTGAQLTVVSGSPAAGQYSVNSSGTYTFAAADTAVAGGVDIYYSYTVATQNQISLSNQLMGAVPVFELYLSQGFTYFGVPKTLNIKLNACSSSKLAMPTKNQDFTIQEVDFEAFADQANNIGTITLTE